MDAKQALIEGGKHWDHGDLKKAAQSFALAVELQPDYAQAHANLGVTLRRLGKTTAAIACGRRAMALDPSDAAIHSNLGNALRDVGDLEAAEHHLSKAVALGLGNPAYAYNLALLLRDRRKLDDALPILTTLVKTYPDNAEYAWDLALTRLGIKDYVQGFAGYEARMGLHRFSPPSRQGEKWQPGVSVHGKRILVLAEQGFGDAILFARFLPLLQNAGATIILECQPELQDLFANIPAISIILAKGDATPEYDFWMPMMSLALALGITWDRIPGAIPYVSPPASISIDLPETSQTRLKVGLIWAGKTNPRDRSWSLDQLACLFEDPRIDFYALQQGPRLHDLEQTGFNLLIHNLSPQLPSFAHTAAAMAKLDLIITIDTAGAHLAGALGRPTWVLLRYVSDWRWLDDGEDCAWYPNMRLFRQPHPQDFATPVQHIKAALSQLLDKA